MYCQNIQFILFYFVTNFIRDQTIFIYIYTRMVVCSHKDGLTTSSVGFLEKFGSTKLIF